MTHRRFTLQYETPAFPLPPRRRRRHRDSPIALIAGWITTTFASVLTLVGMSALGVPHWHDLHARDVLAFAVAAWAGVAIGGLALFHDPYERARLAAVAVLVNLFLALTALLVLACCLIG